MAAQSETLDLPSPSSESSSDPQLSRSLSNSRLNAKAPEFVPTRSAAQPQQQQPPTPPPPHRIVIPPPPQAGMMHVYSPTPPFHVPVHSPVPIPPHMVPVHHHVPVRSHQNHHHHHRQQNQHQYFADGEQDGEVGKKDHKDQKDPGASAKNGLPDEAVQKILNQVEYYFSDINLATTDHLMRFISKDSEGYVPISVVASFKKIKSYTNSHSQLGTVLRNSSRLVVSDDGKKVKRLHPLTESDMEELQLRIIVAENLPEDHCHQNLMKIFSAVGSVKTIRTCQPQPSSSAASSATRSGKTDGMHISNKLHAYVEYESVELAEKAVAELNDERNWRSGLRVRLMLKRSTKPGHARGKKGHDVEGHHEEEDASTSEHQPSEKQSEDPSQLSDIHAHENLGEEHVNDKEVVGQRKARNRGRGKGRGRGQYHQNNHHNSRGNHGPPPSNNAVSNEHPTIIAKQPPGPRMPDGTRGFTMGRGKPVVNTA